MVEAVLRGNEPVDPGQIFLADRPQTEGPETESCLGHFRRTSQKGSKRMEDHASSILRRVLNLNSGLLFLPEPNGLIANEQNVRGEFDHPPSVETPAADFDSLA